MTGPRRVLLAGSRVFDAVPVVQAALSHTQGNWPPSRMVLVHGQCDPRRRDGTAVPWRLARELAVPEWLELAGADWLASILARRWHAEAHPAHWSALGKAAGPARNSEMVALGATAGIALLSGRLPNSGTMDCTVKMAAAGIGATFWCDLCEPRPLTEPCPEHSLASVRQAWSAAIEGVLF